MANGEELTVIQRSFVLNKDQIDYLSHGGKGTIPLVAGQYTPIISWKVPRQEKLGLIQNPRVTMKLYDTNGNELLEYKTYDKYTKTYPAVSSRNRKL